MNTTSTLSPTLHTLLTIGFFKAHQTTPSKNLVATEWVRFTKRSDIYSIYHHLGKGTSLELKKASANPHDERIQVWYKHHLIGNLISTQNGTLNALLVEGIKLSTVISKIEKEKYMPIQNLQVQISKAQ